MRSFYLDASALAKRYIPEPGTALLRTISDDLVLVASDQRLLRAAQAEGLLTFNPETQSQADLAVLLQP